MKTTDGDVNSVECPDCGKTIRDLWDYGRLSCGDVITCDHCGNEIDVLNVDTVTTVTLRSKEKVSV